MENKNKICQNGIVYSSNLQTKLNNTLKIINKSFDDYNLETIFLSFNGGKDCTVLLHVVINYLKHQNYNINNLNCWYFQPNDPFEEIEEFVIFCEKLYNIQIRKIKGSIKEILEGICKDIPELKACIMGSRRTDPYCSNLNYFQKTDPGWPELMRINPMLDWTCNDVWEYIQKNNVPYCPLYDLGYTSLGNRSNTIPNPNLKYVISQTGEIKYYPAYRLENDALERAGRN